MWKRNIKKSLFGEKRYIKRFYAKKICREKI